MSPVTEVMPSNHTHTRTETNKLKLHRNLSTSATTATVKNTHPASLVTLAHNFAVQLNKNQEKSDRFSSSLLKNKALLVPTRLALKRQRAAVKSPSLQYEPIHSATYQLELGNSIDVPPTTSSSPESHRIKSTHLRQETAHTHPSDISLLYREKPLLIHPVTGNYVLQYAEDTGNPSPCSYVLPRKSCREKNAPAYSFGTRCLVEKKGGARTSWHKQWFAHSDPFTTKVDFNRENSWPTPFHYREHATLGFQSTKVSFPAWSIARRFSASPILITENNNPAPDTYDSAKAFEKLTAKSTLITLKSRVGGTQISTNPSTNKTPGPGAHDETKFLSNKPSSPKYSFGKRIPTSLRQDPYVNVLPPNRIQS